MKRLVTIALIMSAFVTLLGLGTWQVQRLAWKEALIAEAETRPSQPSVSLGVLLAENTQDIAYRHVQLTGHFVGQDVRVFTTLSDALGPYQGPGYWVMTPFEDADTGQRLFVNRGFVPYDIPSNVGVRLPPAGDITFEGLARPDDPADWATPEPDAENAITFRRDIAQMAQLAGLADIVPFTVDMPASALPGLPQAGETKFTFTNRHLEYAVTWYGLAAVLAIIVMVNLVQRRKRR